jgi:hypothetical protein
MSKKESSSTSAVDTHHQFIYGDNSTVGGDMWDQARNGRRAGARQQAAAVGVTSVGVITTGVYYSPGRSGMYYVYNAQIAFDTSTIKEPPSKLSVKFGTYVSSNANVASDHKFIITAVQGASLAQKDAVVAADDGSTIRYNAAQGIPETVLATLKSFEPGSTDGGTNFRDGKSNFAPTYEGFISGSSFADTGRFYCDPQTLADFDHTSADLLEIELNRNARLDIAKNDVFYLNFTDYTHNVLYQDPATTSPSPGAISSPRMKIVNKAGTHSGDAVQGPPALVYTQGQVKEESEPKERFEKTYTINAFENMTAQRKRYVQSDGTVSDQVPFQLGIKGPCSLRGRELAADGAWEGDTDAPIIKK